MQQHDKAVLPRDGVHLVHQQLVLVVGEVRLPVDGRQLELIGSHFVMSRLDRNAQFVSGDFQVAHEGRDTGRDGAEIMVIQLLVLGGVVAEQGASSDHQVRPGGEQALVHKEVLLLPAQVGIDLFHLGVEQAADGERRIRNRFQGFLERSLVIQGLAGVGDEHRGDTEGIILNENRRGRVPRGVAAGLESGPEAAAGER